MRKILCSTVFLCVAMLWAMQEPVHATTTGTCSFCHSRNLADCVGCHGQSPSGTQNIIPVPNGGGIPQILHHMSGGDLAGGNFYYVADGYNPDYSKGHNVAGISQREFPPKDTPPGFIGSVIIPGGIGPMTWSQTNQLTCAGTWGCHGDRTVADPSTAISGSHHADDSIIDGLTVGTSYRFLYGVKGREHPTWEYQATPSNHNGYRGDSSYSAMDTISYFCGQCHGQFHPHSNLGGNSNVSSSGVWHRHPVDISFSTVQVGYAGSEYQNYTSYSLDVPVAFTNPTGTETTVDMNSIVMCLSCHRAHASPYQSMLKWDYSTISTTGGTKIGCIICHSQKSN